MLFRSPLACRVVHGVTDHLLNCVCNLRVFLDDARGVSAPSCCAFIQRVAFKEVSGHRLLFKSVPENWGLDIIGMAVATADEKPFHSMAARKVPGAHEAIRLLRNAERVSSICNDVVGDICGVVSGSASATIAALILTNVDIGWPRAVSLIMSALVAGLTVGGKAVGKTFAVKSCTEIVHLVGRVIHSWNRFTKKKK